MSRCHICSADRDGMAVAQVTVFHEKLLHGEGLVKGGIHHHVGIAKASRRKVTFYAVLAAPCSVVPTGNMDWILMGSYPIIAFL